MEKFGIRNTKEQGQEEKEPKEGKWIQVNGAGFYGYDCPDELYKAMSFALKNYGSAEIKEHAFAFNGKRIQVKSGKDWSGRPGITHIREIKDIVDESDNLKESENEDLDRLTEIRKRINELIEWTKVDPHPDDYKKIEELKNQEQLLVQAEKSEALEAIKVLNEMESVKIKGIRKTIEESDRFLLPVYKIAKRRLFEEREREQGNIGDGTMSKRKIIAEMFVVADESGNQEEATKVKKALIYLINRESKGF